jgi:hypothetical protein
MFEGLVSSEVDRKSIDSASIFFANKKPNVCGEKKTHILLCPVAP